MQAARQCAQSQAARAHLAETSVTWQSWMSHLEKVLNSRELPSVLVVVHWKGEEKRKKRCERILAANDEWLEFCHYKRREVVGRAFKEVRGFQGPLTTEISRLLLTSLLVSDKTSEKGMEIVNYVGKPRKALVLQLNIDIMRWHEQNMVFLCSIVGHRDALSIQKPLADPGRDTAAVITPPPLPPPATPPLPEDGEGDSSPGQEITQNAPDLPKLWQYLLSSHSEVVSDLSENSACDSSSNCAICCSPCEVGEAARILACQHAFHVLCIDQWFSHQNQADIISWAQPTSVSSKFSCPICKQDPLAVNQTFLDEYFKVPCRPSSKPSKKLFARRWFPSFLSKPTACDSVLP
mmetsp:Transcript_21934/g.38546  ORF Transcript_21934/g.38546 Transcript_21934/m.38546 type:complete len:350 (+) Transcript_21934:33-1082(+)